MIGRLQIKTPNRKCVHLGIMPIHQPPDQAAGKALRARELSRDEAWSHLQAFQVSRWFVRPERRPLAGDQRMPAARASNRSSWRRLTSSSPDVHWP